MKSEETKNGKIELNSFNRQRRNVDGRIESIDQRNHEKPNDGLGHGRLVFVHVQVRNANEAEIHRAPYVRLNPDTIRLTFTLLTGTIVSSNAVLN